MSILRYLLFFSMLFLLTGCNIVMDYHLDECDRSSLSVTDYGTQANHAIVKHGPLNTDGLYAQPCTNFGGIICNNAQFDAAQQYYMEAPDNPSISISKTGKATFSAWFKTTSTTSETILFKEGEYRLWMNNGIVQFTIWDISNNPVTKSIGTAVNNGNWHQIAVSINSSNITAYIDNASKLNTSIVASHDTAGKLYIGAMSIAGVLSEYFTGNIDEIHMTDDVTSSTNVGKLYNAEVAHKTLNSSGSAVIRKCPCACVVVSNTTIPTWQATGSAMSSTGAITVAWPAHQTDDIGLLFVESQGDADVSLSVPAGFTQVTGSPQTAFTPPACCSTTTTYQTRLTVFWARAISSSMGTVTIADPGDHVVAQIITYRNVSTELNPFDIMGGGVDTTSASCCSSTKTLTVSAVTTTTANTLIVQAASRENDSITASFGNTSYTNTALTSITERTDTGTISGNGGGFAVWDGGKAATGSTGSTTVNSAPASDIPFFSMALKPGIAPTPPAPQCTSFGYDIFHPKSPDNRLQTRIVGTSFDANISVVCLETGDVPSRKVKKIYAVNGECPAPTVGLPVLWSGSSEINSTNPMIKITILDVNNTKAYSNLQLMIENNASQFDCSSDSFAIRPSAFSITPLASPIKATEFNLSVAAINSGGGYTGTANVNTTLQTTNTNCPTSSGFLTSSTGNSLVFLNDTNTSKMKAIDVGDINVTVQDSNWTNIDQPNDCIMGSSTTQENINGLFGCNIEGNLSLSITPYRFDVNATLTNFAGRSFTYLSNDLPVTMSAIVDTNITAKNSDGNTTKNYTSGCFAKQTSLNLSHSAVPSPLTRILYHDSLNMPDGNISSSTPISLSYGESLFTQGTILPKLTFNFDRNSSNPISPFDFNVTSADVNNTDNIDGNDTTIGNAKFVYGRARAYDIKTDQSSNIPNPIELEVYSLASTGYVNGMPQNVLHWYRNLNHNSPLDGNVIRGGFSAGTTNSNINVSASPLNGLQTIGITSSSHQTVHLDITPWLWYSPSMSYDYTGDCTKHPCFDYQFLGTVSSSINGVSSGTFQGADFSLSPAKTIIKKGVKVFR